MPVLLVMTMASILPSQRPMLARLLPMRCSTCLCTPKPKLSEAPHWLPLLPLPLPLLLPPLLLLLPPPPPPLLLLLRLPNLLPGPSDERGVMTTMTFLLPALKFPIMQYQLLLLLLLPPSLHP